jgi:hypothetical protein
MDGYPEPVVTTEPAGPDGETLVHYHFPVEIEVRAAPPAPDPAEAARLALRWLAEGLHAL